LATFNNGVRFTVLAFVLAASAISFVGLDPASKAEAEALATDKPSVAPPFVTSKKDIDSKKDLVQADMGNSR
jgi:hypothetical protein